MTMLSALLRRLCRDRSGNATLLVALGMPALIGGAGLAVDTAQWYMWKRELQYAVDQAAMAGAWARADEDTEATYTTRATQEFGANLAITTDFASAPNVSLADFAGGSQNSVIVSATVSQSLPFSSFLTGQGTTVFAQAQAQFEGGEAFTSCLIATDPDDSGAVTIGGNATLVAGCGIAALSDAADAVIINGNPTVDVGWVVSRGGINSWFESNTDDEIHEHVSDLFDPYQELTPPTNTTPRSYACVNGSTTTTADVTTTVAITYTYKKGSNQNNAANYTYPNPRSPSTTTSGPLTQPVSNGTTAGTTTSTTSNWTKLSGSGQNTIWEVRNTTTTRSIQNVVVTSTPTQASLLPGTYSGGFRVSCKTVLSSGIYVIDGGGVEISGQHVVTGSGVMFVLKDGASIRINGGANITLTAMTASELITAGVSPSQANDLGGILLFEDPNSPGSNNNMLNGNASTVLNGTIYLPNSGIDFRGTASVTSQCLMIAARTITISGTAEMSTFCPAGMEIETEVSTGSPRVRLVA